MFVLVPAFFCWTLFCFDVVGNTAGCLFCWTPFSFAGAAPTASEVAQGAAAAAAAAADVAAADVDELEAASWRSTAGLGV